MNKLALALAAATCALAAPLTPAFAATTNAASATASGTSDIHMDESAEAIANAGVLALAAQGDMIETFGDTRIKANSYKFIDGYQDSSLGDARVVVSLSEQMAYVYRGDTLVGASSVSSGKPGHDSPVGFFKVHRRAAEYYSKTYDNAPMPYMQMFDKYGVALHAGYNPGKPASHGCIRLPKEFARKLFGITKMGTEVHIAA